MGCGGIHILTGITFGWYAQAQVSYKNYYLGCRALIFFHLFARNGSNLLFSLLLQIPFFQSLDSNDTLNVSHCLFGEFNTLRFVEIELTTLIGFTNPLTSFVLSLYEMYEINDILHFSVTFFFSVQIYLNNCHRCALVIWQTFFLYCLDRAAHFLYLHCIHYTWKFRHFQIVFQMISRWRAWPFNFSFKQKDTFSHNLCGYLKCSSCLVSFLS